MLFAQFGHSSATSVPFVQAPGICLMAICLENFSEIWPPGLCHPDRGRSEGPPEFVPAPAAGIVTPVPCKRCLPTCFAFGSQPPYSSGTNDSCWHARGHRVYQWVEAPTMCHLVHNSAALARFRPPVWVSLLPKAAPLRGVCRFVCGLTMERMRPSVPKDSSPATRGGSTRPNSVSMFKIARHPRRRVRTPRPWTPYQTIHGNAENLIVSSCSRKIGRVDDS